MLKKWLVLILIAASSAAAEAQVSSPAARGGFPSLTVGGTFSSFDPDFTQLRLLGFGGFIDVLPFHLGPVNLGLEGDLKVLNFNEQVRVHERTASIGPMVSFTTHSRVRPFVKGTYGLGNFYYPYIGGVKPVTSEHTFDVWTLGAGLDYKLTSRLSARGAYEYEVWKNFQGSDNLTPSGAVFGVSFRVF